MFCLRTYMSIWTSIFLFKLVAYLPVLVDIQVNVEPQKFHNRGNFKSPRRQHATHHNKFGPKHGPNNIPPFAVRIPYQPPAITPVFHNMVPISPTYIPGYQFPARPFLRPDAQLLKSTSDPVQAYVPPMNGNFQPSLHADSSGHDSGSGGRRHNTNDQYGQTNPSRNIQQPASNNFYIQQNAGPRHLIRPPYFFPAGVVDGPNYPGIFAMMWKYILAFCFVKLASYIFCFISLCFLLSSLCSSIYRLYLRTVV